MPLCDLKLGDYYTPCRGIIHILGPEGHYYAAQGPESDSSRPVDSIKNLLYFGLMNEPQRFVHQSEVEVDDDFEVDDDLELVDNDDVGLPEEVELVFMQKMELKLSSKFAA